MSAQEPLRGFKVRTQIRIIEGDRTDLVQIGLRMQVVQHLFKAALRQRIVGPVHGIELQTRRDGISRVLRRTTYNALLERSRAELLRRAVHPRRHLGECLCLGHTSPQPMPARKCPVYLHGHPHELRSPRR